MTNARVLSFLSLVSIVVAIACMSMEFGTAFRVMEWVALIVTVAALVAILARPQAPRMPKIVGGLGAALIIAGVGAFIALTGTASINLTGLAALAVGFIALLAYLFLARA
ncbi:hypothetical protein [Corynebacterium simulans]|uniref:hypothetical protein n=1 Tax=Corynebacterium simulans TaxID=146827 RepID=UPI000A95C33D|nr:hypothetical protein [Corynebacterium simulans]